MRARLGKILIFAISVNVVFLAIPLHGLAKINNTIEENRTQYGNEIETEDFSDKGSSFTGFITYSIDSKWKLTAFFKNGVSRIEHWTPKKLNDKSTTLNISEVRTWSDKMFPAQNRGEYKKRLGELRVEGHFFDNGLVSYEYFDEHKAEKGFSGVKVLLFESNQKFWQINPKAYL